MRSSRIRTVVVFAAVAMAAIAIMASSANAAPISCQIGILDLTANGGLNPATGAAWAYGDQYRFAFITSAGNDIYAAATDIEWYNTRVQNLADASTAYGIGAVDGVAWKVIGSTFDVDARDNTGTNPNEDGSGCAIFLLDGSTIVANDNADLWDGSIQNIIDLTETGVVRPHWPATGTLPDGTKRTGGSAVRDPFGSTVWVGQGNGTSTTEWIYRINTGRGPGDPKGVVPIYAMSDTLTVIPEPATMGLLALGGLAMLRRRRRS